MTSLHLLGSQGFIGRAIQRQTSAILFIAEPQIFRSGTSFYLLDPLTAPLLTKPTCHSLELAWTA